MVAKAAQERDAFGSELSNKKIQITELLRHQEVLHAKLDQQAEEIAQLKEEIERSV